MKLESLVRRKRIKKAILSISIVMRIVALVCPGFCLWVRNNLKKIYSEVNPHVVLVPWEPDNKCYTYKKTGENAFPFKHLQRDCRK